MPQAEQYFKECVAAGLEPSILFIYKQPTKLGVQVMCSMIDGYGRCGNMDKAAQLFTQAASTTSIILYTTYCKGGQKNPILYNTIISAYERNNQFQHALKFLEKMKELQLPIDEATLSPFVK